AEDVTSLFSKTLAVPIIASGGAGTMEDFADVFINANADAALAASVFHFGEIKIPELKRFLTLQNISTRS
ncbi:MAG TPA: HisA/HisF-related TIM barrel protein, partial [Hanamia sp.]|nr:HisA/HisF-related TIM barrel protein [Hanamia sp.]